VVDKYKLRDVHAQEWDTVHGWFKMPRAKRFHYFEGVNCVEGVNYLRSLCEGASILPEYFDFLSEFKVPEDNDGVSDFCIKCRWKLLELNLKKG